MTSLTTFSMGSLPEGFPKIPPGGMPGTNPRTRLLSKWNNDRGRMKTTTWCTRSGNGHCLMQLSCLCWMLAAEWPGSSWMTKLFWTVMLCCRKASCAMSSRKSAQRHGKVLQDKGLRSPVCCLADKFMLSQRNLWPTFTTKGAPTEMITEKTFRKEQRRLQAKHLWMDIKISWNLLLNRMYTEAPTGMSREQLHDLLFNRAAKGNQRNPWESIPWTRPQRSPGEVGAKSTVDVVLQTPTCAAGPGHQWLHTCIPGQGMRMLAPRLIHTWITVQSGGKQGRAHTSPNGDDSCLMWEPPEQGDEEVDMTDIWSFTWMARWTHYKVEEMRWDLGARIVSPFLRGFSPALLWFLCLLGWCCLFGCGFVLLSKPVERLLQVIPGSPLLWHSSRVDRPCPVLARQCRKKNLLRILSALQQLEISWPTMPRARSAIATKKALCLRQKIIQSLSDYRWIAPYLSIAREAITDESVVLESFILMQNPWMAPYLSVARWWWRLRELG